MLSHNLVMLVTKYAEFNKIEEEYIYCQPLGKLVDKGNDLNLIITLYRTFWSKIIMFGAYFVHLKKMIQVKKDI